MIWARRIAVIIAAAALIQVWAMTAPNQPPPPVVDPCEADDQHSDGVEQCR